MDPEGNLGPTETALRNAQTIDEQFAAAWKHVERLRQVPNTPGEEHLTRESITDILRQYEPELTPILNQVEIMEQLGMDASLSELQQRIDTVTHELIRKLAGVTFDEITEFTTVDQVLDFLANPVRPQLTYFSKLLRGLCGVNQEWSGQEHQKMVRTLRSIEAIPSSLSQSRLMERQFWRLQDLCNGAFGFTLELYFLSTRKLLSTFSSPPGGIHQIVFVKTFKAITSGWQEFTNLIGTRQIILNIVYDIAFCDHGIFSDFKYPDYITEELLDLLRRMIDGQADAYIEDAKREIRREDLIVFDSWFRLRARALLGRPRE